VRLPVLLHVLREVVALADLRDERELRLESVGVLLLTDEDEQLDDVGVPLHRAPPRWTRRPILRPEAAVVATREFRELRETLDDAMLLALDIRRVARGDNLDGGEATGVDGVAATTSTVQPQAKRARLRCGRPHTPSQRRRCHCAHRLRCSGCPRSWLRSHHCRRRCRHCPQPYRPSCPTASGGPRHGQSARSTARTFREPARRARQLCLSVEPWSLSCSRWRDIIVIGGSRGHNEGLLWMWRTLQR
jgi:hypothetical protein